MASRMTVTQLTEVPFTGFGVHSVQIMTTMGFGSIATNKRVRVSGEDDKRPMSFCELGRGGAR